MGRTNKASVSLLLVSTQLILEMCPSCSKITVRRALTDTFNGNCGRSGCTVTSRDGLTFSHLASWWYSSKNFLLGAALLLFRKTKDRVCSLCLLKSMADLLALVHRVSEKVRNACVEHWGIMWGGKRVCGSHRESENRTCQWCMGNEWQVCPTCRYPWGPLNIHPSSKQTAQLPLCLCPCYPSCRGTHTLKEKKPCSFWELAVMQCWVRARGATRTVQSSAPSVPV